MEGADLPVPDGCLDRVVGSFLVDLRLGHLCGGFGAEFQRPRQVIERGGLAFDRFGVRLGQRLGGGLVSVGGRGGLGEDVVVPELVHDPDQHVDGALVAPTS